MQAALTSTLACMVAGGVGIPMEQGAAEHVAQWVWVTLHAASTMLFQRTENGLAFTERDVRRKWATSGCHKQQDCSCNGRAAHGAFVMRV